MLIVSFRVPVVNEMFEPAVTVTYVTDPLVLQVMMYTPFVPVEYPAHTNSPLVPVDDVKFTSVEPFGTVTVATFMLSSLARMSVTLPETSGGYAGVSHEPSSRRNLVVPDDTPLNLVGSSVDDDVRFPLAVPVKLPLKVVAFTVPVDGWTLMFENV